MPSILIVDDDKHHRSLLQAIFESDPGLSGFELRIFHAGDGEEGLKAFDEHRPEIVITDLLMPRMDGFRFCEALRQRDHGKQAGVIVASGVYRDASIQHKVRDEYGAVFYAKPYQIKELAAAVQKLLAKGRPAAAPVAVVKPLEAPDAQAPETPAMEGDFATTPLSQLLLDLYERRATGSLELRRGRITKRIDLVVGHPIAVSSNQRAEMLGHFLVQKRVITEAQHQQALERAAGEGEKLGEALVELGILTTAQLVKQLTAQARLKITTALRWSGGAWTYRPNRDLLDRAKGHALDPVAVVLLGLRQTAHFDEALQAVRALGSRPIALAPRGDRLRADITRAFGDGILAALSRPIAADELIRGRHDLVPAVEALLLTGCADAAPGPALAPPPAGISLDPIELSGLSLAAGGASPAESPTDTTENASQRAQVLYDQLFGDEPSVVGAVPGQAAPTVDPGDGVLDMPLADQDSGVIEVGLAPPVPALGDAPGEAEQAREALLGEFLRVQGKDLYAVLEVARTASAEEVERAFQEHLDAFSLERYAAWDLGADYAKLEEVHAAYRRAHQVLSDPAEREAYDVQLGHGGASATQDAMAAEIAFRDGERRLAEGDVDGALEQVRRAIAAQPDVADYHALLGWALHRRSRGPDAQDDDAGEALAQLGQALQIDPDHPAAHEYMGRVLADRGTDDDAAAQHLEMALAARPPRLDALATLEEMLTRNGDFKALERQYKLLIARDPGADRGLMRRLWTSLGSLYRARLGNVDAARTAYMAAARIAPDDPEVLAALDELTAGRPERFTERAEVLRARWRLEPHAAAPGLEFLRAAEESEQHDAAFLAAAVLVARGLADAKAAAVHRRFRPRFLQRAGRPIDGELWARIRHAEDEIEIGQLFARLEPAAQLVSPMTFADLEVSEDDAIPEARLPEAFARVLRYVASVLAVAPPRVYLRADFGDQVHVGAVGEPVLLCGPDALASTDKVDLGFRLARAITFVWPGRAVGGSRPSRVLKAMLIGAMQHAVPGLPLEDPDGKAAETRDWLHAAPPEVQHDVRLIVSRLTRDRSNVNLSRWARALARSADRVGMLVCGDPVVAARAVASLGVDEAVDDLLEYAVAADHLGARQAMALSIDV